MAKYPGSGKNIPKRTMRRGGRAGTRKYQQGGHAHSNQFTQTGVDSFFIDGDLYHTSGHIHAIQAQSASVAGGTHRHPAPGSYQAGGRTGGNDTNRTMSSYQRGGRANRKFSKGGHTHDFYHIHREGAVQDGDSGAYYTSRPYYSQDDEGNFNDTPIDRTIQRGKHDHNRMNFAPHQNQPFRRGGNTNCGPGMMSQNGGCVPANGSRYRTGGKTTPKEFSKGVKGNRRR